MRHISDHSGRIFRAGAISALMLVFLGMYILHMADGTGRNEDAVETASVAVGSTVKLPASRGEIYDRNGKKLVGNRPSCAIVLNYVNYNAASRCASVYRALELLHDAGIEYKDAMPLSYAPYEYTSESAKMRRFLRAYGLREDLTAVEAAEALYRACGMPDYSEEEKRSVLGVIFDLYIADFAKTGTFTLAADIDRAMLPAVAAAALEYPAIGVEMQYTREYLTPYAAHVLGRTGRIPEGETENYVNYSLDAIVGLDGAEYAFESLLRGEDGLCSGDMVIKRARSGNDVYLTIDIELQKTAEQSLEENIKALRDRGIDAEGGAAVVVDIKNSDVLVSASYPSFELENFSENYVNYISDELRPLFNRAISGTYAPGSTFKMVTATAALESGVITPDTEIDCTGTYDYYAPDYVYRCWSYLDRGEGHGAQTVAQALMNSCNCFFYETGRLTGIDSIEAWAKKFGFGQRTGIELRGEAKGVVAGRVERALRGRSWYAGDTLSAAIGQSDTLVTPLQLANYMAALCRGGVCRPHILKKAEYKGKTVCKTEADEVQFIEISEASRDAVLNGLLAVAREGTAGSVFADSQADVLAKSGSAQMDGGKANAVFVLAAPADDPQIAVAVVIERGASGNNAARVAKDIMDAWLYRRRFETVNS